jgi:hypothetical protein
MPLVRYFLWVGGVLFALLLIADSYLPKSPPDAEKASIDPPLIRIQSEQKWPERVVYDTSNGPTVPAPSASAQPDIAPVAVEDALATARDAFAEAPPSDASKTQSADQKNPDAKPQAKRKVARRRAPVLMVERHPQFGWYGPRYW